MSVWDDREFVAAVGIAGVAFIILLLLMLAICLLVFYHRKVNKLNKYSLGQYNIVIMHGCIQFMKEQDDKQYI